MANITNFITSIKNAIYGVEVRDSIADGIQAINAEVENTTSKQEELTTTFQGLIINAGSSNAEIVDARGGKTTLKTRLDATDSEINNLVVVLDKYGRVVYPSNFGLIDEFKINLYKNGATYTTDFDIRTKKVRNGGKTYYVSPNGNDANSGLVRGLPLKDINTAIGKSDVQTIVMLEGDYYLGVNFTNQILFTKSLNWIGEGKVRVIIGEKFTWTPHATAPNVFVTPLTSGHAFKVISLKTLDDKGIELELTKFLTSDNTLLTTPFAYGLGSSIYLSTGGNFTTNDIAVLANYPIGLPIVVQDSTNKTQIKIYMENINIYGGQSPLIVKTPLGQALDNYVFANNCKFLYSNQDDGFRLIGGKAVLCGCYADYNMLDGFNFHNNDTITTNAIEFNCKGLNNGYVTGGDHNNGSTQHDGGKILRVNGEYAGNQGGNVADISTGTQSVNLNCKAYDSRTDVADHKANFTAHSGAEMWVEDSNSYGSSNYDIKVETNATMHSTGNQLLVGTNLVEGTLESA